MWKIFSGICCQNRARKCMNIHGMTLPDTIISQSEISYNISTFNMRPNLWKHRQFGRHTAGLTQCTRQKRESGYSNGPVSQNYSSHIINRTREKQRQYLAWGWYIDVREFCHNCTLKLNKITYSSIKSMEVYFILSLMFVLHSLAALVREIHLFGTEWNKLP